MAFKLRTSSSSPLLEVGISKRSRGGYREPNRDSSVYAGKPARNSKISKPRKAGRNVEGTKGFARSLVNSTVELTGQKLVGILENKPKVAVAKPKVAVAKPKVTKPTKSTGAKKPVITGKIGSDLRRQQYKTAGYKADDTVKKAKVKVEEPIKAKSVKAVATKSGATKKPSVKSATSKVSEKKAPKLAARRASAPKASKNDARKTRKIKKKLSQAAEARAGGNENKALRKEKAAKRKASRLSKK